MSSKIVVDILKFFAVR